MPWLVRGDDVLAAAEVAVTRRAAPPGLIGRDGIDGVLVLRPCRQVHTFGMRFPIDVAFCDRYGFVLHTHDPCAAARVAARSGGRTSRSRRPPARSNAGSSSLGDVVEVKG